jgi:hypothetical protein
MKDKEMGLKLDFEVTEALHHTMEGMELGAWYFTREAEPMGLVSASRWRHGYFVATTAPVFDPVSPLSARQVVDMATKAVERARPFVDAVDAALERAANLVRASWEGDFYLQEVDFLATATSITLTPGPVVRLTVYQINNRDRELEIPFTEDVASIVDVILKSPAWTE